MLDNHVLYKKWTNSVMFFGVLFSFFMMIGEIVLIFYSYSQHLIEGSIVSYLNETLFFPTGMNLLFLLLSIYFLKTKHLSDEVKSLVPIFFVLAISCNLILHHHHTPVCIMALIFPILLSILYSDRKLTKVITIFCVVLSLLVSIFLIFGQKNLDYRYILNLLLSFSFLLGLIYTSILMVDLESSRNTLLLSSLKEKELYHQKSMLDGLTKLYNHSAYLEKVEELKDVDYILSILDIDHFKSVNDEYGHDFGNLVLMDLARVLKEIESEDIFVARYGGEEFVLLFKEKSEVEVKEMLECLKETFIDSIDQKFDHKRITFSAGIASKGKGDDNVSLFNKADKALYLAKEKGRNQIIIYQEK